MVDVRDRSLQAIVLRARDYREQDRLLTLISAESGPQTAIARGARKSGASQAALAQPFCRVSLLLSPPKGGVSFVREGRQEESFLPAGGDMARFAYLSYFSELLLAVWPEGRVAPELYALALASCTLLKLDDDLPRTARLFELRLLQALGLLPPLQACAECGQGQDDEDGPRRRPSAQPSTQPSTQPSAQPSTQPPRFYLSPQQGALLCHSCAPQADAPSLSPGALKTANSLLKAPLTRVASIKISRGLDRELEQSLQYYLAWHVEAAVAAKKRLVELL